MSIILGFVNLGFFLLALFMFKEKNIIILGGEFPLLIAIAFLALSSALFNRHRLESQLSISIIIGILAWQYLNYYERAKFVDYDTALKFFLASEIVIYALLLDIYAKRFFPADDNDESADTFKNKKIVSKSILGRLYFYSFAGCFFSWLVGTAIQISSRSHLIRNSMLSFISIVMFPLVVSNIITYFAMARIKDRYFYYTYQKLHIELVKLKKMIVIVLSVLFTVGCILETMTRNRMLFHIETYLFLFSIILIISGVYRFEIAESNDVGYSDMEQTAVDEIKINHVFIFRYILILTIFFSLSFILLLSLLK